MLAFGLSTVCVDRAGATEILSDPGFEASTSATTNPEWTLTGIASDAIQFWDFASVANHTPGGDTGVWFRSFEGSAASVDGSVQQKVSVSAGTSYELSAFFKSEANFSADNLTLSVTFLDAALTPLFDASLDVLSKIPQDNQWYQYTLSAFAPAGASSVIVAASMINGVLSQTNPQSAFVHDFSLVAQSVPEPNILAIFDLGLFGLSLATRRRKTH